MNWKRAKLPIFIFICQVSFVVIFAVFAKYGPTAQPKQPDTSSSPVKKYYPMFQDVNVMIFIGFGFLMTFLKKYGYSSVGLNFLVAAFVIQWTTIIRGLLHMYDSPEKSFDVYVLEMLSADFCAAGVLISFGAVLGTISPLQLLVMALIEVVLIQVNEWIGIHFLHASDVGESMFIHTFGAYFGLAVSRVLHSRDIDMSEKEGSVYHSDLFSMIGTVFLWMYWPSFNAAAAEGDEQHRAVLNTFYSLTACCVMTFAISAILDKKGKFEMEHIQNATLAGGVAIGTVANMDIKPWGAVTVGSVAAILSVVGFKYIAPFLKNKLKVHDTCGVHNLHGMPGIMAGIGGAVASALATKGQYGESLEEIFPARAPLLSSLSENSTLPTGQGWSSSTQATYQIYALLLTIGMAVVGGFFTGIILKMEIWDNPHGNAILDDEEFWEVPDDGIPVIIMEEKPSENYKNDDTQM